MTKLDDQSNDPKAPHHWKEWYNTPLLEFLSVAEETFGYEDQDRLILQEAKLVIHEAICKIIVNCVNTHLTDHQRNVVQLIYVQDLTREEAAEQLGINYTGIAHAVKGIWNEEKQKFHGGLENKVKKYLLNDSDFHNLWTLKQELNTTGNIELATLIVDNEGSARYYRPSTIKERMYEHNKRKTDHPTKRKERKVARKVRVTNPRKARS